MAGVEVELIAPPANSFPRIEEAESLGALPLFHTYADNVGMTTEAREKGVQLLEVPILPSRRSLSI